MTKEACCAPRRGRVDASSPTSTSTETSKGSSAPDIDTSKTVSVDQNLVDIPRCDFVMGSNDENRWPGDGEGPARVVSLDGFRISRFAVTNRDFEAFVDTTSYVTDAERFGTSFVFGGLLPDDFAPTRGVAAAPWWREVEGASWNHPFGPQSTVDGLHDHPVVHVSHLDAQAFCAWSGLRLPTEAEWECAARGGLVQKRYVWGAEFAPEGQTMCNIFEGEFPANNTVDDGYAGTAPVHAFPANGFGLHNMAGNVWEWCADAFSSTNPDIVIRGGSYLCHDSYCDRYRVSARSATTADSSTGNIGFRVAADVIS